MSSLSFQFWICLVIKSRKQSRKYTPCEISQSTLAKCPFPQCFVYFYMKCVFLPRIQSHCTLGRNTPPKHNDFTMFDSSDGLLFPPIMANRLIPNRYLRKSCYAVLGSFQTVQTAKSCNFLTKLLSGVFIVHSSLVEIGSLVPHIL